VKKLIVLVALASPARPGWPQGFPSRRQTDQRIRQVVYNASEVYEVTEAIDSHDHRVREGETVQYLTLGTRLPGRRSHGTFGCI